MTNLIKTEPEKKELQGRAWQLYQDIQVAAKQQVYLFLIIGKMLKEVRDTKLFKYLGNGGFDTFEDFMNGNPEIGVRSSTGYLYIRVYEYYIETLGMTEDEAVKIPLYRLMKLLPSLKKLPKEEAISVIQELAPLGTYDYDQVVREKKLEAERPMMYHCKECQKYKFQYRPAMMCDCDDLKGIKNLDLLP